MGFDDLAAGREPQARSPLAGLVRTTLCREMGLEHPPHDVGRHATAGVTHAEIDESAPGIP